MPRPADGKFSLDLISAYAASLSRIASWVVAAGVVYRYAGPDAFAMFALVRTTIGLLNYAGFGLAPAMIHELARLDAEPPVAQKAHEQNEANNGIRVLNYVRRGWTAEHKDFLPASQVFVAGSIISIVAIVLGLAALFYYLRALRFGGLHTFPAWEHNVRWEHAIILAEAMGAGLLLRLLSDPSGALLQGRGFLAVDNLLAVCSDVFWIVLCIYQAAGERFLIPGEFVGVHFAWLYSSALLCTVRILAGAILCPCSILKCSIATLPLRSIFTFGLGVTVAQLADFLYAPTDNILINRFINPETVGVYAPAIQIDAGLLVLVAGLSSVLLPRAAGAHASGDHATLLKYYNRGTLASAAMLLVASLGVWLASPWIFQIWFKDPMPATQAILPLVLVHTIVGGSSGVGRSILLGMGKVKAFTIAVLIAGVMNVLMSFSFVYFLGWGLRGIVLGTILAVIGRCLIWMPWYVRRSIREMQGTIEPQITQIPSI